MVLVILWVTLFIVHKAGVLLAQFEVMFADSHLAFWSA